MSVFGVFLVLTQFECGYGPEKLQIRTLFPAVICLILKSTWTLESLLSKAYACSVTNKRVFSQVLSRDFCKNFQNSCATDSFYCLNKQIAKQNRRFFGTLKFIWSYQWRHFGWYLIYLVVVPANITLQKLLLCERGYSIQFVKNRFWDRSFLYRIEYKNKEIIIMLLI